MNEDIMSIVKRLEKNPKMVARLNVMLDAVENTNGEYDLTDDIEEKIFTPDFL